MVSGTSGKPEAMTAANGALAPGIGSTAMPALNAGLHQLDPWIRDAGRPRIGHQRNRLPSCKRLISCGIRERVLCS